MHKIDIRLIKIKVNEYLKLIGFKKKYNFKINYCENCESKKFEIIRERVHVGKDSKKNNLFCYFPFVVCKNCSFLFQLIKFEKKFYNDYYKIIYRKRTYRRNSPSKDHIFDITQRGIYLYKFIKEQFKIKTGNILDVGCSLGGMLKEFKLNGWYTKGNDPDKEWVNFGKKLFRLDLDIINAEDMNYKMNSFDVIIIIGSLEHVYDPNLVLKKCHNFLKKGGILILEGRGKPIGNSMIGLNHNHYRIFSKKTFKSFTYKHRFKTIMVTDKIRLTGPVNKKGLRSANSISWVGKKIDSKIEIKHNRFIENNRDEFLKIKKEFDKKDLLNPLQDAILIN